MKESNFIIPIRDFRIDRTSGLALDLTMPGEPEAEGLANSLATFKAPGQLLWGAGGGTYLVNENYAVMVRRSSEAPTNPGKWTFATGLGASYEELQDPRLFIRELFEELVLKTIDDEIIIPRMRGKEAYLNARIEAWITHACKQAGISYSRKYFCSAVLLETIGRDRVTVNHPTGSFTTHALLHLDESVGRVNLLSAVKLEGLSEISEVEILDTELGSNQKPLRRQTAWCDIRSSKLLFPRHDAWLEIEGNITPHADHLLKALQRNVEETDE